MIQPDKSEKFRKYDKHMPKHQLIYKTSGEVITHYNGKVAHITPGTVYVIPKSSNADYYVERKVVGDCIDIFFDTDTPPVDELFCIDFSSNKKISDLFNQAYNLWLSKPDGYYCKTMAAVYKIMYEMLTKCNKYAKTDRFKKIDSGVDYIKSHLYDNELDYYMPSKLSGISYTYFKKLFVERFGIPPVQYVTAFRLERAAELLLTNQYSVSEIASMCGFESVYYFSRKFKEKYGSSPTAFKNERQ